MPTAKFIELHQPPRQGAWLGTLFETTVGQIMLSRSAVLKMCVCVLCVCGVCVSVCFQKPTSGVLSINAHPESIFHWLQSGATASKGPKTGLASTILVCCTVLACCHCCDGCWWQLMTALHQRRSPDERWLGGCVGNRSLCPLSWSHVSIAQVIMNVKYYCGSKRVYVVKTLWV